MRGTRKIFSRAAANFFFFYSVFGRYSLSFFIFCIIFAFILFLFFWLVCFLALNIYILIHIWLSGRVTEKSFPAADFRTQNCFIFWPINAIFYTCPKDVMFTNHIFEWQIRRILDCSRFSLKEGQYFKNRFFKLSFHIFFIWNHRFIFTSLSK